MSSRIASKGVGTGAQRPKVVVVTGPTAVGKTELSLLLAEALQGEIISADSVQVYNGLDIGSAKVKLTDQCLLLICRINSFNQNYICAS